MPDWRPLNGLPDFAKFASTIPRGSPVEYRILDSRRRVLQRGFASPDDGGDNYALWRFTASGFRGIIAGYAFDFPAEGESIVLMLPPYRRIALAPEEALDLTFRLSAGGIASTDQQRTYVIPYGADLNDALAGTPR